MLQRQMHRDLGPVSAPGADSLHLTAVQFRQSLHQRQTQSQSSALAVQTSVGLGERTEQTGKKFRLHADAIVANDHDRLLSFRVRTHLDGYGTSAVQEFDRIVEQVL